MHPHDRSTKFLSKINSCLRDNTRVVTKYIKVHPNDKSHEHAISKIQNESSKNTILVMSHGMSDAIHGAKGDKYEFSGEDLFHEHPDKYYYKKSFIDVNNISIFKDKKVICLSCNSNQKIAKNAIENGCLVFIGFGNIPSSVVELEDYGMNSKQGLSAKSVVQRFKTELNFIIKKTLEISIEKNYTFKSLVALIKFISQQRISLLAEDKRYRERYAVIELLYNFKQEVKLFGDQNMKLKS